MNKSELLRWCQLYLAVLIGESIESINTNDKLAVYDLDSIDSVTMAYEMEEKFGFPIHPDTFVEDSKTLEQIIEVLYTELN